MAYTDTDPGLQLTTLRASDEPVVRAWLADFLRHHNRTWADALDLGWSAAEVEAQQIAVDLVERHWSAVHRASRSDGHFVALARLDGRPLGVVWLQRKLQDHLGVPIGVLDWVYVAPWGRGHGVGTALLRAAKEWMRLHELRSWQVSVLADNPAALRLYRSAGLQIADVRMMGPVDR